MVTKLKIENVDKDYKRESTIYQFNIVLQGQLKKRI
jgi:hypothetical protein